MLYLLSGAGNLFLAGIGFENPPFDLNYLRTPRVSLGIDGFFSIIPDKDEYRLIYWNNDGGRASLCVNSVRCGARLINFCFGDSGEFIIVTDNFRFFVEDASSSKVSIVFSTSILRSVEKVDVADNNRKWFVDVGVPHLVVLVDDLNKLKNLDLEKAGRYLRNHNAFSATSGTNVNFVHYRDDGTLFIRTYERGIEGETLSCSSGIISSWFALKKSQLVFGEKIGIVPSSEIVLELEEVGNDMLRLKGDARLLAKVEVWEDLFLWKGG